MRKQELSLVVAVERQRHPKRTLVVNISFVGKSDYIRAAEVLEVVENGLIVRENGRTKLVILANATTVEFVDV